MGKVERREHTDRARLSVHEILTGHVYLRHTKYLTGNDKALQGGREILLSAAVHTLLLWAHVGMRGSR